MILGLALLLGVALVLLVAQPIRLEVTALLLVFTLGLTGILSPEEALSGFSSPATITVAAMLVISAGLERAGVVDWVAGLLSRRRDLSVRGILARLLAPVAGFSAVMNNTPIVALMVPTGLLLARRSQVPSSQLLMPISFFAILGGTCTLLGTSTNILVDSLSREMGGAGFGIFEFTPLGLLYLGVGAAYVLLLAPRLLPARAGLADLMHQEQGVFVTEVAIPEGSDLVGTELGAVFPADREVRAIELVRDEEATLAPPAGTVLKAGDLLLVEGTARSIHELLQRRRVDPASAVEDDDRVRISRIDLHMVEAVIQPNSGFEGRQVRALGLNRRHGIKVLAIRRLGQHHQYNLRDFELRAGDVLLLQGERGSLRALQEDGDVLLIEGVARDLTFPQKAPLAVGILLAVIGCGIAGVAPISILAVGGAAAMLMTRCLSTRDATRALEPSVLLLLAGMIPLGVAMTKTGMAAAISDAVVAVVGESNPILVISVIYLLTSVLTEILSNNAAAVLLVPICLGLAERMGIDAKPLLVAVAFGGSASFATPVGYQTNTMVMGPGGYRFADYLRFGGPLNLVLWLFASVTIPLFWAP